MRPGGDPHVSVVMPAHDAEAYVGDAVSSILSQELDDLELIAVDDGSTDRTGQILDAVDDRRLVVVHSARNEGVVAALNAGLERARGRLVAIHHADDVALPDRLATQAALFERDSGLVLCGSAYELIDEGGAVVGAKQPPATDAQIRWASLFGTPFGHPTLVFRGDVLRRHAIRYDDRFFPAEDYELASRVLALGRAANVQRPLVRYRVHGAQVTSTTWDRQNELADEIARRNLAALGVEVAPDEMPRLRALHYEPPRRLGREELPVARLLWAAAVALSASGRVGRADARRIRRAVLEKLAVAHAGAGVRGLLSFAPLAAREPRWALGLAARRGAALVRR